MTEAETIERILMEAQAYSLRQEVIDFAENLDHGLTKLFRYQYSFMKLIS